MIDENIFYVTNKTLLDYNINFT